MFQDFSAVRSNLYTLLTLVKHFFLYLHRQHMYIANHPPRQVDCRQYYVPIALVPTSLVVQSTK